MDGHTVVKASLIQSVENSVKEEPVELVVLFLSVGKGEDLIVSLVVRLVFPRLQEVGSTLPFSLYTSGTSQIHVKPPLEAPLACLRCSSVIPSARWLVAC